LATDRIFEISEELIEKVKTAAGVSMKKKAVVRESESPPEIRRSDGVGARKGAVDMVVIGISTGGPQALKALIPKLPADFTVPVAMVLHMPVGYTELYAKKLNEISRLKVIEAREGDEVKAGVALLAPAGRHLTFQRRGDGKVVAHLDAKPFDTPHRPAVDVLFQSAAEVFGGRVLGVVMTGMGLDGKAGASWIKARGGQIITEAEETCVVYGMPRSVVEAGLSDKAVPLYDLAGEILKAV
jgi:two-component system chemotaxis response regulator CheB